MLSVADLQLRIAGKSTAELGAWFTHETSEYKIGSAYLGFVDDPDIYNYGTIPTGTIALKAKVKNIVLANDALSAQISVRRNTTIGNFPKTCGCYMVIGIVSVVVIGIFVMAITSWATPNREGPHAPSPDG